MEYRSMGVGKYGSMEVWKYGSMGVGKWGGVGVLPYPHTPILFKTWIIVQAN
ncbi:MAG TPA: hypothetical protein VNM22_05570 [Candidatus Limnocylindrales bacterium]|nr:hypothetical protein [Candidatus Limnocylindrales bacterium]